MPKSASMRAILYHRRNVLKSPVTVAFVADQVMARERIKYSNLVLNLLGYELKSKKDLGRTPYTKLKNQYPTVRINNLAYVIKPRTGAD